jgi:hypothetical protein
MDNKIRITVQCLSLTDGSVREVVAHVPAETEQEAVNKLYAIGKDEIAYRYLGMDGVISPENPVIPAMVTKYAEGEWYARA